MPPKAKHPTKTASFQICTYTNTTTTTGRKNLIQSKTKEEVKKSKNNWDNFKITRRNDSIIVYKMTNAYSFDGVVVLALLMICTCAYIRRVPKLKEFLLSEKKGVFGVLYKAAVIGIRLHWLVSISCAAMAVYVLVLK